MIATDHPAHLVAGDSVAFGLAELDLLTTHAGSPLPYPARIPRYGRTTAERAAVLAMANATLTARGLADDNGPTGMAAELVTALRGGVGTVDLVVTGTGGPIGVLALRCGPAALVCRKPLTRAHANRVTLTRLDWDDLADELCRDVPDLPGAPVVPITLDAGVAATVSGTRQTTGDQRAELAMAACADQDELDRLADLLPTVTGRGQLGASMAGRRAHELSWLDTPSGRVRIDQGENGWLSVNPLSQKDIHRVAQRIANSVAAPSTGREPW